MRAAASAVFLASMVLVPACGRSENLEQELSRFMNAAEGTIVEYRYTEALDNQRTEVVAKIEDSIRHSEILSIDGVAVIERVVYDDLLAVRVMVPDKVPQLASPDPADLVVADALRGGQWVIDPAGAPPEGAAQAGSERLGVDPFKDATSVFQYARLSLEQAAEVFEFNPDRLDYLAEDDPFPKPNEEANERRFDIGPPPLPRREGEALPGAAPFRKMSFYVLKNRVIRIIEETDIESQADVKRAHETGRNQFFLRLARDVKLGRSSEPVRERSMLFEILAFGTAGPLQIPQQGVTGNLRVLFGEKKDEGPSEPGTPTQPPGVPVPAAPGGGPAPPAPPG
jgi:hypothetical protein